VSNVNNVKIGDYVRVVGYDKLGVVVSEPNYVHGTINVFLDDVITAMFWHNLERVSG
jgi:hypothetical protein